MGESHGQGTWYNNAMDQLAVHLKQQHSRGINTKQIPVLLTAWDRESLLGGSSCPICNLAFALKSLPWPQCEELEGVDRASDADDFLCSEGYPCFAEKSSQPSVSPNSYHGISWQLPPTAWLNEQKPLEDLLQKLPQHIPKQELIRDWLSTPQTEPDESSTEPDGPSISSPVKDDELFQCALCHRETICKNKASFRRHLGRIHHTQCSGFT
ncbi:hypothetical protein BJX99DRAFT_227040 [Aspergillus californicus]